MDTCGFGKCRLNKLLNLNLKYKFRLQKESRDAKFNVELKYYLYSSESKERLLKMDYFFGIA